MLIQALEQHFKQHFDQNPHHNIILWFDPQREYEPLLNHLTAYPIWRYEGSLLHLRYDLIHREDDARVIVYLPLKESEVEVLRPFFASSYRFSESLYRFLRRQGFDFPDDPDVAHELRRLLPRLAVRSLGKGRGFWAYNLANLERARETLLGNFDQTLLRFLTQPARVIQALKDEQLEGLFFAQLESSFGLAATPEDEPQEVAARLTAQLVLVRAYVGAGAPADFPYPARLPEPLYFERNEAFLATWQRDTLHGAAYATLTEPLAQRYDLARWIRGQPLEVGLRIDATFADVEAALWDAVQREIRQLKHDAAVRNWLLRYQAAFKARAEMFWARQGEAPWWDVLAQTGELWRALQDIQDVLDEIHTPAAALEQYVVEGWRVDHAYRILREQWDTQTTDYGRLRHRSEGAYRTVLRRMNERFSTLLEDTAWPPQDSPPPQDAFWRAVESAREGHARIAVLFVDALRYELGQALREALTAERAGDTRTLTARRAAIPTITPIGMSALLPQAEQRRIRYDGEWEIHIGESGNLKDKAARKAWLARQLDDVGFYNLDQLLHIQREAFEDAEITIVFDTTLDAVGESAQLLSWATFGTLLQSLKKTVHKLLNLGITQIHVVADHGFLLLDRVGEHEKVSLKEATVQAKGDRYALRAYAASTDQLSFTVPGSHGLQAWFPRGIGCFRTPGPYNFVHGGLSLQEVIIPHLVIERQVQGRPVQVAAEFPDVIRNAQPSVTLQPVDAEMFDQPRQVTIALEKEGKALIPPLSQVVSPAEPVSVNVFLPMGCGLLVGDRVRWILRDAHTEEILTDQAAVSQVDIW